MTPEGTSMLDCPLILALILTLASLSAASEQYQIDGRITGLSEEGEAILATAGDVLNEQIEIARAEIHGGEFHLRGNFDEIERAVVTILTPNGDGRGSVSLVLEAAPVLVRYDGPIGGLRAEGGEYNRTLIDSWQQSDEYREGLNKLKAIAAKRDAADPGAVRESLSKKYWETYFALDKIRSKAIDAIALSDQDPLASSLAIQLGALRATEEAVARLNELEKILGPRQGLAKRRAAIKRSILERGGRNALEVEGETVAMAAPNVAGETIELAAVLKQHKYVLLEFWASWCGPCLKEVPGIKKAHQAFHDRGFEVFAISLDDDRKAWVDASERLSPPWINVSDLKGYESPFALKFGVSLIPRNFLLDKSGNIVAHDLRGPDLEEKLHELLGN